MVIGTKADFSQNDPRWGAKHLGKSSWETIGRYGCLVDSFANVAQAQGQDFDPGTMNDALVNAGEFVTDVYNQVADVRGYASLTKVAPHSKFVEQQNWPGDQVAPYGYFDVGTSVNTEIIIMIDYHPETAGIQSHYCRVIGLNTAKNDIFIVDSWDGQRKWLSTISNKNGKHPNQIIWTAGKYIKV